MRFKFLVLVLLIAFSGNAQLLHPQDGPLYNKAEVSRIDILIDADSLAQMLLPANLYANHEYPATMIYTANGIADTVPQVGFRLRGNTSRAAQKKSFKIAVNSFISGRRYQGVKKINLNGEHNDPSISRARLCWELGAEMAIPVSRVAHTALYINGTFYGVYINIEHINDDWLGLRYTNASGNLYKCTYPANLQFIGNNPNDYKVTKSNGERVYELQTNENIDDYSGLAHFIDVLNNTPLAQLECALDDVFNIESYMQALAFEVATGHWDNYSFNQNNYYLYENPQTGKIEYIPYDMDNTYGIDWMNIDWANRNVNNWNNPNQNFPLADRLLALPQLKEMYQYYLAEILQTMGGASFSARIDSVHQQILPHAYQDTYKALDYGFTNIDFKNSIDSTQADQHVKLGIKTYVNQRVTSGLQQLGTTNTAPIIRYLNITPTGMANQIRINCSVADETQCTVQLAYQENSSPLNYITLYDDGQHNDGAAGDGVFGNLLTLTQNMLSYQVIATDNTGKSRTRPCAPASFTMPQQKDLVINELMADNDAVIADNTGNYSDWIELYNAGTDSIFLGDYFLTDDLNDPTQWQLPAATLAPGAFQLIWASNNPSAGIWHTNFALSKGGEEVGLFKQNGTGNDTADFILFGAQNTDISYGRNYDASPVWVAFNTPTPGTSNGTLGITTFQENPINVFPLPHTQHFTVQNTGKTCFVALYDARGVLLYKTNVETGSSADIPDSYPAGLRILRVYGDNFEYAMKLIKQ